MKNEHPYDVLFKIILIGDAGVGKSSLLHRFTFDTFEANKQATIGVEFGAKILEIDGTRVKSHIWDTAGQEKYEGITSAYYRGAAGAFIVYDISNQHSYDRVPDWLRKLRQNGNDSQMIIMLIANKNELKNERVIPTQTALQFAVQNNLLFMETSALLGKNVNEAFETLYKEILKVSRAEEVITEPSEVIVLQQTPENTTTTRGCC